jgi:hypothetical protein
MAARSILLAPQGDSTQAFHNAKFTRVNIREIDPAAALALDENNQIDESERVEHAASNQICVSRNLAVHRLPGTMIAPNPTDHQIDELRF